MYPPRVRFLKTHLFLAGLVLGWSAGPGSSSPEPRAEDLYLEAKRLAAGLDGTVNESRARELYREAARQGDPRALAWEARQMFVGRQGFRKNVEEAKATFARIEGKLEKMARERQPDAQRSLAISWGTLDQKGKGAEAFRILQESTASAPAAEWDDLAWCHEQGIGTEIDLGKAYAYYRKSAEGGNLVAYAEVGLCHEEGKGVSKNFEEAFRWYQHAAERGESWSQTRLGDFYLAGKGTERNERKAADWYRKAAEQGSSYAQSYLAFLYEKGKGVPKDEAQAATWYRKAAEQGDATAQGNLGLCYELGRGVAKDEKEAMQWYTRAADQGDGWAWNRIGLCYEYGRGVEKDFGKALAAYRKSAEAGNDWGQNNLGNCYARGYGTERDPPKALEWFEKAAGQGLAEGMANLGYLLETGDGVTRDETQAFAWYLQAAEKGNVWSMGKVAEALEQGKGTEPSPKEAFRWWMRQAEAGDFWAPEKVARCHTEGIGTAKNPEEGRKWYERVRVKLEEESRKNSAWAWDNLGRFFFNGLGVEKNYVRALECYRQAAALKSGWAMEQIGWFYENGLGGPKDEAKALEWYRQAAEHGQAWSMGHLGVFYETGRGTQKNPGEAYRWYRKKAETDPADLWAKENLGRCHENAIGTKKDDREALRWYEKAAAAGSLWAGEQAGRFYEEGLGTEKNPEKAYGYYLPAVRAKRAWAQHRMVGLGTAQLYENEYDFAERCFQAAWDSEFRMGADWLHLLHTRWDQAWETADPLKGILSKRKSLEGQPQEGPEVGQLAGEALRFGYVEEAKQMARELLASPHLQAGDEEKARWHVLAGYAEMVDVPVDPRTLQGKRFPESWLKKVAHPPAVGMATFNFKLVHPQSRLDFAHNGDFVAPIAPRRWASYLVQHARWGVRIWREQQTRGFKTLALTATGGPGKGGAFLWAGFPVRNTEIVQEHFALAETLAPNFAGRMARAVLAWQAEEPGQAREVLDPVRQEVAEEALAAAEKRRQKNPNTKNQDPAKRGWGRQLEHFSQTGIPPWGNVRGEVSFGFGFGGGSGLFHGQLVNATWKLVVPFFLWLKPDWMLVAADFLLRFGALTPMQLTDLYTHLAEKEETRAKACARLAMIQAQLGEKEEAWQWAERSAKERPTDLEVLRMTVAIAQWANKPKEFALWQNRLLEAETRKNLLGQDSPEKEYLRIFEAMREAEELEAQNQTSKANLKFQNLLHDLNRLRENHPDWESAVVQYRIRILEKKLAPVEKEK